MEQNKQQKSSLVLKYAKRRYDGGPEVDMIRSIERKQMIAYLNKIHSEQEAKDQAAALPQPAEPDLAPPQETVTAQPAESTRKSKVLHALVLGPVQISVGLVGIMTAGLAIFTFHRLNNQQLLRQSQGLLTDCAQTLRKGMLDTVATPVRVLKVLITKG